MIRFLDLKKITDSFQPELGRELARVVDSGYFVRGKEVQLFEEKYARFVGTSHCVGVGNGFDALRLLFRAWISLGEMQEGDEVLVPANTYIASLLAVTDSRLTPVLIEPDINTFNIDPSRIEERISQRTKALMVVHLYGRNAMSDVIVRVAEKYRLKLVEDNAQAAGGHWRGRKTGSLGHAAAHSFFPTKNLGALGDGGAVTCDDGNLAQVVRTLANYGSSKRGVNDLAGANSRLDELQAAVLALKLRRLDQDNGRRREVAEFYLNHIRNPHILLPRMPDDIHEHVWHLFVVRSSRRDDLQQYLLANGVEALIHYPVPPHKQKAYHRLNGLHLPVTEQIHREVLSLPLSPVMDDVDVQKVVNVVNAFGQ